MADTTAVVSPKGPMQFQSLFDVIPFSATCTLTATAGAETSQLILGVTGALQGDLVIVGIVEDAEAGALTATVSANEVVELILTNATGGTITIAAGTVVKGVVLQLKEAGIPV